MPVLLWVLKFLGILLLVLLALLLVVLVMPVGFWVEYRGGVLRLTALLGPVRLRLWPRPAPRRAKPSPAAAPPQAKPQEAPPAPPPAAPAPAAAPSPPPGGKAPAPAPSPPAETDAPAGGAPLPAFLQRRLDAVIDQARRDPIALARCLLGHLGWLGRRLLHGVRVTHLAVFWTVHRDEASATAVTYGSVLALLNALLALLRQWMTIRADSLRLEPDFTGEQAGARQVSFRVRTRLCILAVLMLRLARRLWRDPMLQPKPAPNHN